MDLGACAAPFRPNARSACIPSSAWRKATPAGECTPNVHWDENELTQAPKSTQSPYLGPGLDGGGVLSGRLWRRLLGRGRRGGAPVAPPPEKRGRVGALGAPPPRDACRAPWAPTPLGGAIGWLLQRSCRALLASTPRGVFVGLLWGGAAGVLGVDRNEGRGKRGCAGSKKEGKIPLDRRGLASVVP